MANEASPCLAAADNRSKVIIKTSAIGILTNVLLAAFKAFVGFAANSIAVILDAVNNLSDALASVVTIIGARLANRLPDKEHPLGHGRIEYLSAMVVAGIVLYAGIASMVESVRKIFNPQTPSYSMVSLLILAMAVVVKIILGRYFKAQGAKVTSGSLKSSGADATFDAILSLSVLASAIIFILSGVSLEAWVGAAISGFIIKSGLEMMRDTLDDILGRRADKENTGKIKSILTKEPCVHGAYDLIIFNYGPERNYASVHLELPEIMTVAKMDRLTRKLERTVYEETGVILTAVGVYAHAMNDEQVVQIMEDVRERVLNHAWALQFHGFFVDTKTKEMRFDVVMSFDIDVGAGLNILYEEIKQAYPSYTLQIVPDVDASD